MKLKPVIDSISHLCAEPRQRHRHRKVLKGPFGAISHQTLKRHSTHHLLSPLTQTQNYTPLTVKLSLPQIQRDTAPNLTVC